MCGIVGILDLNGNPVAPRELESLRDELSHRGPDDAGIHIDRYVGLGNRRLAVIDISSAGHQPMSDPAGELWLTWNGELYNFQELRQQLTGLGHKFISESDTEVLLYAYKEWGPNCVDRLIGMFALAIWDSSKETLWLARDRLGVKPLYYTTVNDRFIFSSEVHNLYRYFHLSADSIDPVSLDYYLAFGVVPADRAFVQGINKLPPAHMMSVSAQGIRMQRYWRPEFRTEKRIEFNDALEETDAKLRTAVSRRLVSDVPLGIFLSGGIDSGLVTSIAAELSASQLSTFSVRFGGNDPEDDESQLARSVAERYGTDHHEIYVGWEGRSALPELVSHFGEPFADISALAVLQISRAARPYITVALGGDGGDESFCGYSNVRAAFLAERYRKFLPRPITGPAARFAQIRSIDSAFPLIGKAGRWVSQYVHQHPGGHYDLSNHWNHRLRRDLYAQSWAMRDAENGAASIVRNVQSSAQGLSDAEVHLYTDLHMRLPADYLTKVDIASNMASLEVRSPFLDHELVEFAASVPPSVRMRGGKQKALLRELARRYLPAELITAPKRGFGPPLTKWLREDWRDLVDEFVVGGLANRNELFNKKTITNYVEENQSRRANHTTRIWSLLALELWFQMFVDRQIKRTDTL